MEKRLAYHWGHSCVVVPHPRAANFPTELVAPPPGGSRTGRPPLDLPLVVRTPPPHVESAIPLEPTSRVELVDPALGLPEGLVLPGLDLELVRRDVVPAAGVQVLAHALEPRRRELGGVDLHLSPEDAYLPPPAVEVAAPEDPLSYALWRGEQGRELREVLEHQLPRGGVPLPAVRRPPRGRGSPRRIHEEAVALPPERSGRIHGHGACSVVQDSDSLPFGHLYFLQARHPPPLVPLCNAGVISSARAAPRSRRSARSAPAPLH
mmetsp:Transcript_41146/g.131664  ORF Transcript_41146/g.131664 Transcript_41146/m.131664 type:complete len:264 (-) Transcript_41146:2272-3063(-)